MNQTKLALMVVLGLVLSGAVGAAGWFLWRSPAWSPPLAPGPVSPSVTPAPHPLSIAGLRAHAYQASSLTTERQIGGQDTVVSYRSDGRKVFALMSTPAGNPPEGGWPVIIFCHGYINPAQYRTDGPEYREFIATLVRAGYVVLKPDYRGHGQSEGSPVSGHFAPDYAQDILSLVATLKQTSLVNGRRIGLIGHSLGGHVALRTIVVSGDIKATAVLAGVVGSMEDLFYSWRRSGSTPPPGAVLGARQQLVHEYGDPRANPQFWNSVSAIRYVDAVTGPVQVHHAEADSTVPKLFSDHLVAALQQASKPVEYYVYPGDDHQFMFSRVAVLARLVAFMQANV